MRRIVIRKGFHYPFPFLPTALPFWVSKKKNTIKEFKFKFTDSCMFNLHDEDQHDINKLFGFSIGHHQKRSSFRFGWRPILDENRIELVGYEYHDGVRQPSIPITRVKIDKWYRCLLTYVPTRQETYYSVSTVAGTSVSDMSFQEGKNSFNLKKKGGLGYTLGIYFGGNERAPQKITILKEKSTWKLPTIPI